MKLVSLLLSIILFNFFDCENAVSIQQPSSFAQYLPANTGFYIEIQSLPKFIDSYLENFLAHDPEGLDTKEPYQSFSQARPNSRTFLQHFAAKLLPSTSPLIDRERELLRHLSQSDKVVEKGMESEVFRLLSSFFSGPAFFSGVTEEKVDLCFLFGFQYDPTIFNWPEELKISEAEQLDCVHSDGVEIFHLKSDGILFFTHKNMFYGYTGNLVEEFGRFSQHVVRENKPNRSLATNRRYQRALSSLINKGNPCDMLVYFDAEAIGTYLKDSAEPLGMRINLITDLAQFKRVGDFILEDPTENRTRIIAHSDSNWSPYLAAAIRFDINHNAVQYRVAFPLIAPIDETTDLIVNEALSDLDSAISRTIYPVRGMTYFSPRKLQNFPGSRKGLFGFSLSFWRRVQEKSSFEEFGQYLISAFNSSEAEVCRVLHTVSEEERHLFGPQRCYGAFYLKSNNSFLDIGRLEGQLESFFSSEEFAEIREIEKKRFDNFLYLRKFQVEKLRNSSEFEENSEQYLEEIRKLSEPPEQGVAAPIDESNAENDIQLRRIGVGNAMIIETPYEVGVISLLTKRMASEFKLESMMRFEFDRWLGYKLSKCGRLKLLSLWFSAGPDIYFDTFEPCSTYLCEIAKHLAYSPFYRSMSNQVKYEFSNEISSLNCLAKFCSDRFLRLRCFSQDKSRVHAIGLVYGEDRIEIHGLIRLVK